MRGKAFMLAAALAVAPSMGNLAKTCVGLCTNQCTYEDADKDGVCDNIGSTGCGHGTGCAYEDADNDGICDHIGSAGCGQGKNMNGNGRGAGMGGRGYGNGRHCG